MESRKHILFEDSMIASGAHRPAGRVKWFFLFAAAFYGIGIGTLIVTSIMMVNPELAETVLNVSLVAPPPPPPPPPPPAGGTRAQAPATPDRVIVPVGFVAPTTVPKRLPPTLAELPDSGIVEGVVGGVPGGVPGGVLGGVPGGVVGGVLGGVVGSTGPVTAPTPPPPSPKVEEPSKPIRVTTGVLKGNAIRRIAPDYPIVARNARLEGTVDVAIVVDEAGSVVAAEVVRGHPLFRDAALRAARQWKFRPTLVSGRPIKVSGILTFVFQLERQGAIG